MESRQQCCAVRLATMCSDKLRKLYQNPSSGIPVCRGVNTEDEHGRTIAGMSWPAQGEESVVKTITVNDATAAKSFTQRCAKHNEAKVVAGVRMWRTDGWRSDHSRMGAQQYASTETIGGPVTAIGALNKWRSLMSNRGRLDSRSR